MQTRKALRNTYLWGPVIQGMFLMSVAEAGVSEVQFYLYLFLLLVAWAFFFKLDNPRESILETERYRAGDAIPQIIMGVMAAVVIGLPMMLFGVTGGLLSPYQVIFQVLMVANVETLWMIFMVRFLPWGAWLWPIMFAVAHPVVRMNWFVGQFPMESFVGFAYAFFMGIVFYLLWTGHRYVRKFWKPFFGPVTPWACHAALNLIVTVFTFVLWGLRLSPI